MGLMTAIEFEVGLIDKRHNELVEEKARMKRVMKMYDECQEKLREKEEEEARLQKEVDEMRRRPEIRAALTQLSATAKGRPSMRSSSAFKPSVESSPAPASVHSPMPTPFQDVERPPLDFSRDSTPDGLAQSPPKDDEPEVINEDE